MADLTITAANVVPGSSASRKAGTAGETITAGQAVYFDPTALKWLRADSNSATAAQRQAGGIALNSAALNQPISVAISGDVTIGATLTPGLAYYLSSNPGGICPVGDVVSGDYVCLLGLAKSSTVLSVGIEFPGVSN